MSISSWVKLVLMLIVTGIAAFFASGFSTDALSPWYVALIKPEYTPPASVFGLVWFVLYALMAVSAFLVWKKESAGGKDLNVRKALGFYIAHLVINVLWSYFFFARHDMVSAFIDIVILWWSILAAMILFGRSTKWAVMLMLPYILWVSFAVYLNFMLIVLNIAHK